MLFSEVHIIHLLNAHAFPLTKARISIFIFILLCNCYEEAGGDDLPFIQWTLQEW